MSYYIHKGNRKRYAMLQDCKIKVGDLWIKGVVYLRDGKMFCRSKLDFFENFEKDQK